MTLSFVYVSNEHEDRRFSQSVKDGMKDKRFPRLLRFTCGVPRLLCNFECNSSAIAARIHTFIYCLINFHSISVEICNDVSETTEILSAEKKDSVEDSH